MITNKHKVCTTNFLIKALKATTNTDNLFRGAKLSLVGVAYNTDLFEEEILCHTAIENVIKQGSGLTATVTLKPLPSQLKDMQTLEAYLNLTGEGTFTEDIKIMEPVMSSPLELDLTMSNSVFSNIQDYKLELSLDDVIVHLSEFKLKGESFYQFVVETTTETVTLNVNQHLVLLFKAKKFDDDDLFSSLVTEQEKPSNRLGKQDTYKLLDLIMEPNVTGLLIGGVVYNNIKTTVDTVIYPYSSNIRIAENSEQKSYVFIADTGVITLYKEGIKYSTVNKVGTNKYELNIVTKVGTLSINLG